MRFQIEFWFWAAVFGLSAVARALPKRLWHLLFAGRYFSWHTSRFANAWISWYPHIGLNFAFSIEFIPWHNASGYGKDDEIDQDAEVRFSFSLPWLEFSLTIPNDFHPDDDIEL